MTTATQTGWLTLGQAARRVGCDLWMLQRIVDRKLVPAPARIGKLKVVAESDLPQLKRALQAAGFLGRA
jgi:hypothetical protein